MSTPLPIPNRSGPDRHAYEVVEFDNTPDEIYQEQETEELPVDPIPATIVDPVRSQAMPARIGAFTRHTLSTTDPIRILDRDPRRKRAVITLFDTAGASDGAILGSTQAVALNNGFLLPLPGPGIADGNVVSQALEITSLDEVWAAASGAACTLSVLNEQWSE